jgi:hypothetical protein
MMWGTLRLIQLILRRQITTVHPLVLVGNHCLIQSMTNPFFFSPCGSTAQFWALAASMKLSVSFRLVDLGQSAGLLEWVISSSQGLCLSAPSDCEDGEVDGMNGFGRGTEVLGENQPRRHFVHHKFHLLDPGANSGRLGGKPATNRFTYDAAIPNP